MKNTDWRWGRNMFVCSIRLGERAEKHDEKWIPVVNVIGREYWVQFGEGDLVEEIFEPEEAHGPPLVRNFFPGNHEFQVVSANKRGEEVFIIRKGEDLTGRVLLFVGHQQDRGEVSVCEPATSGKVLSVCSSRNGREGKADAAVILDVGEQIVFNAKSDYYGLDLLYFYCWNGLVVECREAIPRKRWEREKEVASLAEEGEVI